MGHGPVALLGSGCGVRVLELRPAEEGTRSTLRLVVDTDQVPALDLDVQELGTVMGERGV